METTRKKITFLFLASVLLISCSNSSIFNENIEFGESGWNKDSVTTFSVNIDNTKQGYDVFINLKNTDNYQFSNLYLFTKIISTKGDIIKDTVECVIANAKGKWYGEKQSELYYNKLLFRKNIAFPIKRIYKSKPIKAILDKCLIV